MQTTLRNIFFFSLLLVSFLKGHSQQDPENKKIESIKETVQDSLSTSKEINLSEIDSTQNDTIKKKQLLDGNVVYSAKKFMRLNRTNNQMYLYDDAKIKYTDLNIESGSIIVNHEKEEVYAKGINDTADVYTQTPVFKQGSNLVEPDTIRFNFKSKKALIYNSKTNQDGFNILNEVSKRENDSVIYMKNVRFTTSENIEDPEYYFYARRIKFIPKKKIVTGLVNMYIADVPTPIGLPFAYFPFTEDAASGFILPSFNDSGERGFELQNGGYFFAINDYVNLSLIGSYATNTSFSIRAESDYAKRYRFSGNFNFRFENNLISERGLDDFSKTTTYNLQWTHRRDRKANPNSNFSANVNFGSSQFFNNSTNQSNIGSQLNNTLSSSVSYSKTIRSTPGVNISSSLNISQNTNTESISISAPINVSTDRVNPFAPKTGSKKGLLQNINLQLTSQASTSVITNDDEFLTEEMLDDVEFGISHSIPISTNFNLFKHISGSLSIPYNEFWVFETIDQNFDEELNEVVTDTIQGFDRYNTYGISTSLSTTVYGAVTFKKDAKIQALRHVIRPSISYSYQPKFDQFFETYEISEDLERGREAETVEFNPFQGGAFGGPSNNETSSLNFSFSNNIEAKIKSKDTLQTEPKKITLLNNLTFSSGYDFKADSLKLRAINFSGSIPIVDRLTLAFSGGLDPYALDENNNRVDVWNIDNGGSLLRLTGANLNFGYSFSSTDIANRRNKRREEEGEDVLDNETFRNGGRQDDLFGSSTNYKNGQLFDDQEETPEEKRNKTDVDFYNYKIPWNLSFSYAVRYSNAQRQDEITSHNINFSGDIELAPRWRVGVSSGYNLLEKELTFTNLRFQRDLESWNMSFNWTPFTSVNGTGTWNFFIGITSNVLSDIKWDKQSEADQNL